MRLIKTVFFILMFISSTLSAQIYVAPDGNDSTNTGTIDQPFESIQRAQELVNPGDTVFIRGGTYQVREDQISKVVSSLFACIAYLDVSGTEDSTIKYWAYPGETPIFDFSNVKPESQRVVGIYVTGSYIHIKGLEMTGIQVTITTHTESYCIYSKGNNNIYEQISMHDNVGTGIRHYKGGGNLFLNCDSYKNWDNVSEEGLGTSSDGFGCHPDAGGTGNVFRGCRAWFNSDDGFDIIRADEAVVFDSCWAFFNGYSSSFESLGDGNGFKAGGYASDDSTDLPTTIPRNTVEFCIAARNLANGFYSNHHLTGNYWYNNTAYYNATNFNMVNRESRSSTNLYATGYDHVLINNLSYKPRSTHSSYADTSQNTRTTNSFDLGLNSVLSSSDFLSTTITELTADRKDDGSLPDIDFMVPTSASVVIDMGTDIGFEYLGDAPELGALEVYYDPTDVQDNDETLPDELSLSQNYPNPFNPVTNIVYEVPYSSNVKLTVYDILGREIMTLVNGIKSSGSYKVSFDGSRLASGIYFYRLEMDGTSIVKKMMLLK